MPWQNIMITLFVRLSFLERGILIRFFFACTLLLVAVRRGSRLVGLLFLGFIHKRWNLICLPSMEKIVDQKEGEKLDHDDARMLC